MKYYKYQDEESGIGDAITYVETENNAELRRITYNGTTYIASNVIQPDGNMNLADTRVDYEDYGDEVISITKQEFDAVWQAYLTTRQHQWNLAKHNYPVGINVEGHMYRFPPLGVIVILEGALGVADYSACRASTKPEFMYPRHKITAVVASHDEENQWIVLESPQVHEERIS